MWVGSPPAFRGGTEAGRNLEQLLTAGLPNVPLFIEKPVSTGAVDQTFEVAKMLQQNGSLVSVGYMKDLYLRLRREGEKAPGAAGY